MYVSPEHVSFVFTMCVYFINKQTFTLYNKKYDDGFASIYVRYVEIATAIERWATFKECGKIDGNEFYVWQKSYWKCCACASSFDQNSRFFTHWFHNSYGIFNFLFAFYFIYFIYFSFWMPLNDAPFPVIYTVLRFQFLLF